jgi:hypothetical protein
MFRLSVLLVCIFIIVVDFRTHRISNAIIAVLTGLLLFDPHRTQFLIVIAAALLLSILFTVAKIGMGDLKMTWGLLISQGELLLSIRYLHIVLITLAATLVVQFALQRNFKGSVAFAHVILIPFLAIYLAI